MGRAVRRYLKSAGWFGGPSWQHLKNNSFDETQINDLYEDMQNDISEGNYNSHAVNRWCDEKRWDAINLAERYNLYKDRHTTASDELLNRAKGYFDQADLEALKKIDRTESLEAVRSILSSTLPANEYIRSGTCKLTPDGQKRRDLSDAITKYLNAPKSVHDAEVTTPEIASRYKPTPSQMKRWLDYEAMDVPREARRSGLMGALIGGGTGALAGLGIGMIPAGEHGIGKHMTGTPGRAALMSALLGGTGALVGGLSGYSRANKNLSTRRNWALSHLKDVREQY